jgi:hypothetical protein
MSTTFAICHHSTDHAFSIWSFDSTSGADEYFDTAVENGFACTVKAGQVVFQFDRPGDIGLPGEEHLPVDTVQSDIDAVAGELQGDVQVAPVCEDVNVFPED